MFATSLRNLTVVAVSSVFVAACAKPALDENADVPAAQLIRVTASENGFEPEHIAVPAGVPVVLEFLRTEQTCADEVWFTESGVKHRLPLNEPVRVSLRLEPGQKVAFTCPMDMFRGEVVAEGELPTPEGPQPGRPDADGIVAVTVDQRGFHPPVIEAPAGKPTTLRFTRVAENTCNTAVVMPSLNIRKDLPLNAPVDIHVEPSEGQTITFACPMDMSKGTIRGVAGDQ